MGGIHQNLLDNYEFRKNRRSEGHTLPKGVINELLPYFLPLLHDLVTNQYKKFAVLSICEFLENRREAGRTFLTGVYLETVQHV